MSNDVEILFYEDEMLKKMDTESSLDLVASGLEIRL